MEKVTEFIVLEDQPFSVVENVVFQSLIEHLEPQDMLPNQHAISDTIVPHKYKQVLEFISNTWKMFPRLASQLTSDVQTCVQCHY